jgi:hypothetical protein
MPPLLVALPVIIVIVIVLVIIVAVIVVIVIRFRIGLGLWVRRWRLRLGFRTGCGRLRSGRWAGAWLRRHIVTDQQGKLATAAALAVIRQRDGDAPIDMRAAGCEGEKNKKIFHHSGPNLSKTENDLRYDFIKRSICSSFHLSGSPSTSTSSR